MDIGLLLRIMMHWWQLQAGVSYSLLELPDPLILMYLAWDWFSCFQNFLCLISGSLHVKYVSFNLPPLLCKHDQCLIDIITSLPGITIKAQETFNIVQIYLGVVYLLELSSVDGCQLCRDAWQGSCPRHTPLLWPYQAVPNQSSFQAWCRQLATAFLANHRPCVELQTHDLTLVQLLGQWLAALTWLRTK
jgi:hypothetical protein